MYSLGAVFYFCLTGQPPYPEGTAAQKLIWHQTRDPKPISAFRKDVPKPVVRTIAKMMAKDRNRRYRNAVEAGEVLASLRDGTEPPEEPASGRDGRVQVQTRASSGRWWRWLSVAAGTALLALSIFAALRR